MCVLRITAAFVLSSLALAAYAGQECKHDAATAKTLLSAIYSGEKAFHMEKKTYSDDFGDIGFDPNISLDDENCDNANWSFEITQVKDPNKFTATAYSRVTGEEYTINESKEIKKKDITVTSAIQED